jgi:hypothetical protein
MEVVVKGHTYKLTNLHYKGFTTLNFYKDPSINEGGVALGTNCQEVIRALIDRVEFLDGQKPWSGNQDIIAHLRAALALFEARAIIRKVEKGLSIEKLPVSTDGHLIIAQEIPDVCV